MEGNVSLVTLIEYADASAEVKAVYDDIMRTRGVDWVNNFWKALANDPAQLRRIWDNVKQVMAPGALDPLVKEMADVESPPGLSVGPHLDSPVAAPPGMPRLLEQQRVLHCGTGFLHGGTPGFDLGLHADFCHGPPQRHVAFVGIFASQGGPRREKTDPDAKEFQED